MAKVFWGLNQNLICPWSIFDKVSILFFRFLPEFCCSYIFVMTEHTQNQFLVARYLKFCKKNLLWSYLDGILGGFSKIRLFIVKNCILIKFFFINKRLRQKGKTLYPVICTYWHRRRRCWM